MIGKIANDAQRLDHLKPHQQTHRVQGVHVGSQVNSMSYGDKFRSGKVCVSQIIYLRHALIKLCRVNVVCRMFVYSFKMNTGRMLPLESRQMFRVDLQT